MITPNGNTRDSSIVTFADRLTWVEIDADALANNVRLIKAFIGPDVALMAVVKADAYGHGAVLTARTALQNGATYIGVSSIQEALDLRAAGIDGPIIALNYTPPHRLPDALRYDITLALYDLDIARSYDRIARSTGETVRVHFKIDTGMGRLGVLPESVADVFRAILDMPGIHVEGIYTHFSVADEDAAYTRQQFDTFTPLVQQLQAATGHEFRYIHAANSAGTINHPDMHLNMVRTGIAMYGMHPSEQVQLPAGFKPVMSWKTIVAQVKTLPPGHMIGYGNTYTTTDEERIAILPVGYADGFRRTPYTWREVLIRGQRAPLVGRVSMEKSAVSVSHIPGIQVGDEAVLLGRQGADCLTAEEVAGHLHTINYELTCTVLPRIPRR